MYIKTSRLWTHVIVSNRVPSPFVVDHQAAPGTAITLTAMPFLGLMFSASAAQLLQHVVHLQHLAVEPGFMASDIPGWVSPGNQVARSQNRSDQCARLRNGPAAGDRRLLVHAEIKARWPHISNLRLILVTYAGAFVLDFVMEAGFMLPFGLYTIPVRFRRLRSSPVPIISGPSTRDSCGAA